MKLGVVGDVHWSRYSSIVRSRGEKYSLRLENCIKSINWAEKTFDDNDCEEIVYLGDFFDKPELNAEEITALKDIKWSNKRHYFLTGNHEITNVDLSNSSASVFSLIPNKEVLTNSIQHSRENIVFIPYTKPGDDGELFFSEFLVEKHPKIIFSHNDIKGIQMGKYLSKAGFDLDSINNTCELFINGHLHNGEQIGNLINLGNLTGQNFSEDAFKYKHRIMVIDTYTLEIEYFDNPYAFNFCKIGIEDLGKLNGINNCVVTLQVPSDYDLSIARSKLEKFDNVVTSRIIREFLQSSESTENEFNTSSLSINHIEKFIEYATNKLGSSELVVSEVQFVR